MATTALSLSAAVDQAFPVSPLPAIASPKRPSAPLSCVPPCRRRLRFAVSSRPLRGRHILIRRHTVCIPAVGPFIRALSFGTSPRAVPPTCSVTAYLIVLSPSPARLSGRCRRCFRPRLADHPPFLVPIPPPCSNAPPPCRPLGSCSRSPRPMRPFPRPRPPISHVGTKMSAIGRAGLRHTGRWRAAAGA